MAGEPARARVAVALTIASSALLWCADGAALEREWHVGASFGFADFVDVEEQSTALVLGGYGAYGLSDMFDVNLELMASGHELVPGETTRVYSAAAGMTYKVDVIEWVPYIGALLGWYAFDGAAPEGETSKAGFSLTAGINYYFDRHWGAGAQVRYHGYLDDPPTSLGRGSYFTGVARAEYRWGF